MQEHLAGERTSRLTMGSEIISRGLVLLTGCAALLFTACLPYKPTLFLEKNFDTIPASVSVEALRDASPPDDKEHVAEGVVSQTGLMEGDLSALVTQALVAGFSATSLFRSISNREAHPDLVLTGTIHRFYGQATVPSWFVIPGVAWAVNAFASPEQEWLGEVDLELTLAKPTGEALGTYRGHTTYREMAESDSRYWSTPLYPAHARLNRAFTDAVQQIQEQILRDRELLRASLRN